MSRFQSVDEDIRASDLVQYLDCLALMPAIQSMRAEAFTLVAGASPRSALDLGCGTGDAAQSLARLCYEVDVVGIDASEVLLTVARDRHPEVTFVQGDACALDVAPAAFEVCYAERLLMHLPNLQTCLDEVSRALRPGGLFVSIEPSWSEARLEAEGGPEPAAFLADFNLAIAQPAAPEKIVAACAAMGWKSVSYSNHLLSAETFSETDAVIRFSNALARQGVAGEGLEQALRVWERCFRMFQLPFTVQAWRT